MKTLTEFSVLLCQNAQKRRLDIFRDLKNEWITAHPEPTPPEDQAPEVTAREADSQTTQAEPQQAATDAEEQVSDTTTEPANEPIAPTEVENADSVEVTKSEDVSAAASDESPEDASAPEKESDSEQMEALPEQVDASKHIVHKIVAPKKNDSKNKNAPNKAYKNKKPFVKLPPEFFEQAKEKTIKILSEELKLEEDKTKLLITALEAIGKDLLDLKRVVVYQIEEGTPVPRNVIRKEENAFLAEYYPPLNPPRRKPFEKRFQKGGRKEGGPRGRDRQGGFDKRRGPSEGRGGFGPAQEGGRAPGSGQGDGRRGFNDRNRTDKPAAGFRKRKPFKAAPQVTGPTPKHSVVIIKNNTQGES